MLLGTIATKPGTRDLSCAVDGYLEFALDHFVNHFLQMEMLVNSGAAFEVVMRDGHDCERRSLPRQPGKAFDDISV